MSPTSGWGAGWCFCLRLTGRRQAEADIELSSLAKAVGGFALAEDLTLSVAAAGCIRVCDTPVRTKPRSAHGATSRTEFKFARTCERHLSRCVTAMSSSSSVSSLFSLSESDTPLWTVFCSMRICSRCSLLMETMKGALALESAHGVGPQTHKISSFSVLRARSPRASGLHTPMLKYEYLDFCRAAVSELHWLELAVLGRLSVDRSVLLGRRLDDCRANAELGRDSGGEDGREDRRRTCQPEQTNSFGC